MSHFVFRRPYLFCGVVTYFLRLPHFTIGLPYVLFAVLLHTFFGCPILLLGFHFFLRCRCILSLVVPFYFSASIRSLCGDNTYFLRLPHLLLGFRTFFLRCRYILSSVVPFYFQASIRSFCGVVTYLLQLSRFFVFRLSICAGYLPIAGSCHTYITYAPTPTAFFFFFTPLPTDFFPVWLSPLHKTGPLFLSILF